MLTLLWWNVFNCNRCQNTVGRNPEPPGIYKTLIHFVFEWDQLPTSTGEFTGFLNHQQYIKILDVTLPQRLRTLFFSMADVMETTVMIRYIIQMGKRHKTHHSHQLLLTFSFFWHVIRVSLYFDHHIWNTNGCTLNLRRVEWNAMAVSGKAEFWPH